MNNFGTVGLIRLKVIITCNLEGKCIINISSMNYLLENFQHVAFNFDEQDLEGMKQLLQLTYYHGLINDLIDVKYV